MNEHWAYTAIGAIRNDQQWDLFGPTANRAYESASLNMFGIMNNTHAADKSKHWRSEKIGKQYCNLIGFDGKSWTVAGMALPSVVLDPDKYPEAIYSYEKGNAPGKVGRRCHFLHGYESATNNFPEKIPVVDAQHFVNVHENNIIPLWERHLADESILATKTITSFQPAHAEVPISQQLHQDAIDYLRRSHRAGRPAAIEYEIGSKKWNALNDFASSIRVNSGQPVMESWVSKLSGSKSAQLAIVGGTVALGTLGAWWLLGRSKTPDQQPKQQAQSRTA